MDNLDGNAKRQIVMFCLILKKIFFPEILKKKNKNLFLLNQQNL